MNPATWFFNNEIGVFPLQDRSKEPACKWTEFRCSRAQAAEFKNYGVRLGALPWPLAVADADNPDAHRWCGDHLPHTPFQVKTGRGVHYYYRLLVSELEAGIPKFIRRDGLTIEFRHQGQYVVGPGSIHPSGSRYEAASWSWRWEDVPVFYVGAFVFDDGSCGKRSTGVGDGYEFPERVYSGERHAELFKLLRQFKALGNTKAATREIVALANETRCHPPLTEGHPFEAWFDRAWSNPDRPLAPTRSIDPFGGDAL